MPPTAIYSSTGFTFNVGTESSYNSGTMASTLGALGIGAKFTSYELNNAWTEAYQIGQRPPQAYYTAGLKAPFSTDFYMCQDQVGWLAFVLGPATGGTYTVGNTINSGMVQLNTAQGDLFTLGGIAFTTCKFAVNTGAPVTISLNGVGTSFSYANASTVAAGTIPSQLLTWKDVSLTFANPVGTVTTLVQSLEFTIDTGAAMYYAIGSAFYQAYLPLQSKISGVVKWFHQDAALEDFYYATSASVVTTITATIGTHTATFLSTFPTKATLMLEPVKEVTNEIDFVAINMTFV